MNMLREFLIYLRGVLMGRRDSLPAFIEPLTLGEHYLRWGTNTCDIRDFRKAMDYLHLCKDRDAPMASLLIRKYACIGAVATAAVETLLMRHRRIIEDSIKTENRYREEIDITTKKISQSRDYMRKLQGEGSLIQVQSVQEQIQQLEASEARLREMLDSGEVKTEIYKSYDDITLKSAPFFRELDHASAVVMANALLGSDGAGMLSGQLQKTMKDLQAYLEKANPVNTMTAT